MINNEEHPYFILYNYPKNANQLNEWMDSDIDKLFRIEFIINFIDNPFYDEFDFFKI